MLCVVLLFFSKIYPPKEPNKYSEISSDSLQDLKVPSTFHNHVFQQRVKQTDYPSGRKSLMSKIMIINLYMSAQHT